MPRKLTEAEKAEREEARRISEEKKAKRRAYLVPDLPEDEFVPQARARVYRMKVLSETLFTDYDPETDLYKTAEKITNKLRAAHNRVLEARARQAAAVNTGNTVLIEEENENYRKHYKDFIYHHHVIGSLYSEFMEEVGDYGSI